MKLKSKVLVLFLSAITLSMFLFLLFCYDSLHNGYYSGINETQIKQVLNEAENELRQFEVVEEIGTTQETEIIQETDETQQINKIGEMEANDETDEVSGGAGLKSHAKDDIKSATKNNIKNDIKSNIKDDIKSNIKSCLNNIEEKHSDMYLAVLKSGEWISLEDLPQVSSYKEVINLSFGQSEIYEKYKVSAKIIEGKDEESSEPMVILCYVPLDKMEALSYKVNFARGNGLFGKLAIVGIMLTLMIMLVFLWFFSRKFFKRIRNMNEVIEAFSNDHMDIRMNTEGTDEIAHIAKAFNAMADRLEKSYEEKERYESNRKKLVSDISHDLRTPLSSVLGYSEMLQNKIYESEEEEGQFIDIIHRKAVYMEKLLSELLEYSRLEMGTLTLNKAPMDIVEMLRQILIEYIPSFEKKHYALEIDLPEYAVIGEWDELRLRRVIHNVIGNALKYGMDGKKLLIQLKEESNQLKEESNDVCLTIRDYGVGIDKEDLEHIKERFYRSDRARNSKIGGMGLGTYIADEIIRLHGGNFLIESQKGEGTTVRIRLKKSVHTENTN